MQSTELPNGVSIAYDAYDFTPPWIAAEPVLLVHGFSKNRSFWYPWIPALASRYRVICPDQRAHGDSSRAPADFRMSLRPFADDMAAFLDAQGIDKAHVVMAEFTSSVALEFAIAHPDRIRSLVLPGFGYNWGAAGVDYEGWARMSEGEGAEAWARATNGARLPADADPRMKAWYIAQQGRMQGHVLASLFRFCDTLDLTDRLPLVQVPTLILAGSRAQQEPVESVRKAAGIIPHCRLVVLEGMPFNVMSAAPERCVEETLRFFEDVRAGTPLAPPGPREGTGR